MAKLINGNGNLAIYAEEDADWFGSIFGNTTAITGIGNQFAYSLLDANTVGVQDGVIISKEGRRVQLNANEIDEFDIPTGAQGTTSYYIIGYHLITDETSAQTCETFVELMDNGTDTIPEGTFRGGDDDVYISLYRVKQVDLAITQLTLLLPKVSTISEINHNLNELIERGVGMKKVTRYTTTSSAINQYGVDQKTINLDSSVDLNKTTFRLVNGAMNPTTDNPNPNGNVSIVSISSAQVVIGFQSVGSGSNTYKALLEVCEYN